METPSLGSQQQQEEVGSDPEEFIRGVQAGEIFVRLLRDPRAGEDSRCGTLHGARPFVLELLGVGRESDEQRLAIQRHSAKVDHARTLRRQLKARRAALIEETQWTREAVETLASSASRQPVAWLEYTAEFEGLAQSLRQHVAANALRLYALLDAERAFIREWLAREEALCSALRLQTKLLYRFSSFALQLENETAGQVRMRRLPLDDPQRRRCVKAASENVKRSVLAGRSVEVEEVYKVENRALLDVFQRHAAALPSALGVKIKGLFCCVPTESVERCVVFGMHSDPSVFEDGGVRMFGRPGTGRHEVDNSEAPGTSHRLRARSRAMQNPPLAFPRKFSRYSTLEASRTSSVDAAGPREPSSEDGEAPEEEGSTRYLMLCRVAMGRTERAPSSDDSKAAASFADSDSLVGTLLFPDEEEFLARYPQAVVPEFLLQYRLVPPAPSPSATVSDRVTRVDLANQATDLPSEAFRELIVSPASRITAFPLHLRVDSVTNVFSEPAAPPPLPRRSKRNPSVDHPGGEASADVVLANCARQKTRLREDIDTLYSVFWVKARDAWARAIIDHPSRDEGMAVKLTDTVAACCGKGGGGDRRVRP